MFKGLVALFFLVTLVPVSIATMMWGWGLEAHNWGWIAFGYLWMILPAMINR